MRIFLAGTSFNPSYGGPAHSVSRLGWALAEQGHDVTLWAPDGSARESPLVGDHRRLVKASASLEQDLRKAAPDLIHDNGIWLPHQHKLAGFATREDVPRVVSIRGMLQPWAMQHKAAKKKLAWWLYQKRDLSRAALHHVTASHEIAPLIGRVPAARVCCIPNGIDCPSPSVKDVEDRKRIVLFVGRLYPVKGLPLLLEAWSKLLPGGWKLRLVGPDEAGHRAELEALVRKFMLGETVTFTGPLAGEVLAAEYRRASLFVLPSHTENFGMAIGEAMAHALPVITTQGAPWKLLEQERCGWWVPVSVDGIANALADATQKSPVELAAMGAHGAKVVGERFAWDRIAQEFIACYRWLLGEGGRPDCVRQH